MVTGYLYLKEVRKMPSKKKSSSRPNLTIVIPAYSEEKRIGKSLDELAQFLKKDKLMKTLSVELIVVSADSADKTHEIVTSKLKKFTDAKLLKPGERVGKGRDVKYAMLKAKGDAVIFMDADLATPLKHLPKFYKLYLKGNEVIIATRNLLKHHPSAARRLLSNTGNLLFRVAGGVWVEDSQCGFKMFSHKAAQVCFSKQTIMRWGFDMEILAIARANKFKITSCRVNDWVSVPEGTFVEGIVKSSLTSLGELGHIFWNRIKGTYKA